MKNCTTKSFCITHTEICIRENICSAEMCICVFVKSAFVFLCELQNLHLEKYLRCRFAHFVHRRFLHICQICAFVFCTFDKVVCRRKNILRTCASLWKRFAKVCAHEILFFSDLRKNSQFFAKSVKMSKKSKFPKMSRKCPKKAHVFLSGTRVVPGPTRLTTQGGKSRQNMH